MIDEQEADLIDELLNKSLEKFLCDLEVLGDQRLSGESIKITDAKFPRFEWILGREAGLDKYTLDEFIRGFSLHISYRYKDNFYFTQDYELIKDLKTGEVGHRKTHSEAIVIDEEGDVIGNQIFFSMRSSPSIFLDEVVLR